MNIFFFYEFDEDTGITTPYQINEQDISPEEFEFFNDTIRKAWSVRYEEWYFSIQDVIKQLTDSTDVKQYIKKMKQRAPELNNNWGTICTLMGFLMIYLH